MDNFILGQEPAMDNKEKKQNNGLFNQTMIDIAAGVSSIVASALTVYTNVTTKAYENLNNADSFDVFKKTRETSASSLREKVSRYRSNPSSIPNEISKQYSSNGQFNIGRFIRDEEQDIMRTYNKSVADYMKESERCLPWQKWGVLRLDQKIETVIWAAAAAGITIGAIWQISNLAKTPTDPIQDNGQIDAQPKPVLNNVDSVQSANKEQGLAIA